MKVLHVATTDFGGAGLGMINLHKSLLSYGIDSKILLARKTAFDNAVFQMSPNYQMFKWSKCRIVRKVQDLARRRGFFKTELEYWNDQIRYAIAQCDVPVCYTSPITNYDIVDHPLVRDADIIHLHWIGNFLDYKSFFSKIDKPVVWTLRDENPGLGGFHYRTDKKKYYEYFSNIENEFSEIKKEAVSSCKNLSLIALSDIMIDFCKTVEWLNPRKIYKIYNSISNIDYFPTDKMVARKVLNINDDVFTVSFVSVLLKDHRKGLKNLLKALDFIEFPVRILCVGKNDFFSEIPDNVICYGSIEDSSLMSLIYSASDVFVNPTLKESFGKTTVEGLMCGVPVISTPEGVAPEIIDGKCGVLIRDTNPETIANAIKRVKGNIYDRMMIRERVESLFSSDKIGNQHVEMYEEVLRHY